MEFEYQAGFPDDPWQIRLKIEDIGGTQHVSVYRDDHQIMHLRKTVMGWELHGRLNQVEGEPAAMNPGWREPFAWDEISAVTDEVENRLEKAQKNPN